MRTTSTTARAAEPIAIVGMGCRFPGAPDLAAYWRLLLDGVDATGDYPGGRFADLDALYSAETPALATRRGGFLDRLDLFDADFFGVSPREAACLDPQHRLLLETAWEALEDAGIVRERIAGSRTGVFVGLWTSEYDDRLRRSPEALDFYGIAGAGRFAASGRLSFVFDLRGPSVTVDTACSSSLVAVHLACQSIWSGQCDLALAGGANVVLGAEITAMFSQANMISPEGRCKFADARGDGFVRSDGAGMVVLKPLALALADGDPVYALVRGSAVNNDGRSNGQLMTPSVDGQEAMLREALASAGVDPDRVVYVEAHGTGTLVGDPVEIEALTRVFATPTRREPCRVGSVKTNLGHTEAAAGVAGLIKVALALRSGVMPASLFGSEPNPRVPWDRIPVEVQREASPLGATGPVFAGVSSFSLTGTNAHVVVEGPPPRVAAEAGEMRAAERPFILPLSAHTPQALEELARAHLARARGDESARPSLADLCYTAGERRAHHAHRAAIVARDWTELSEALEALGRGEPRRGTARAEARPGRRVAFVYAGQGGQWDGMGLRLLEREPVFREVVERCDAAFARAEGWSLIDEISGRGSGVPPDDLVLPALFAVSAGLTALWRSFGVEPEAVVGHSLGEAAAAWAAGALDLDQAARVVATRARLMRAGRGRGGMALVGLPAAETEEAIRAYGGRLVVGAVNSPTSTAVSGDLDALAELGAALEARGVFCRRVKIDVASHSDHMEAPSRELAECLADLEPRPPAVPLYSTVTGLETRDPRMDAEYWRCNLRRAVRFAPAIELMASDGIDTFVEIGPHPVLSVAVLETVRQAGRDALVLASLRREQDDQAQLLSAVADLYAAGAHVDWSRVQPARGRCVSLPAYPFQRERFWIDEAGGAGVVRPPSAPRAARRQRPDSRAAERAAECLHEVAWLPEPLGPPAAGETPGTWLVLADRGGAGARLARSLEERGARCVVAADGSEYRAGEGEIVVDAEREEHFLALFDELSARGADPLRGVVHLWSLDAGGGAGFDRDVRRICAGALGLVRAIGARGQDAPPRLWFATAGAGPDGPAADSPAAGLLAGLGAVVAREHPELRCTRVDLAPRPGPDDVGALALALLAEDPEDRLAIREGARLVARLRPLATDASAAAGEPAPDDRAADAWRAEVPAGSGIDAAATRSFERGDVGAGEVEIEVAAAGLNFLDVLKATGAYGGADPRAAAALGVECAGRVARVGDGVADLRVGDEVVAVAPAPARGGMLASHVTVPAALVAPKPAHLTFEEAATAPLAFMTAHHALVELGRLRQGERVLIHAAAGGVGLAALQVARRAGARVLATAGSEEKRAMLRGLGVEEVFDSRSVAFARGVTEATGGAGVDVVLNSLSGDLAAAGLGLLAPFGRFVELGRRDIDEDRALGMGAFAGGVTVAAVDLAAMAERRPGEYAALFREVMARVSRRELVGLPVESFPAGDVAGALGHLAAARHVGKVAVSVAGAPVAVRGRSESAPLFRAGRTYLVTGGLGGVGLRVARWMAGRGARHIALAGRREPGEAALAAIPGIEAAGAEVRVFRADVSDAAGVAALLEEATAAMPPLAGVLHAATALDPCLIRDVTWERFEAGLAAKARGAWNLHEATRGMRLDWFVLFSSAYSTLGVPGDASYATANAFLDALARFRRARGLPATCVGWGAWSGVGLATEDGPRRAIAAFAEQGVEELRPEAALEAFERLLRSGAPSALVAPIRADVAAAFHAGGQLPPLFRAICEAAPAAAAGEDVRAALLAAEPGPGRRSLLEAHLQEQLARVLKLDPGRVDRRRPMGQMGLDSLMALELVRRLGASAGVALTATEVFNYPTVAALAGRVAQKMEVPLDAEAAPAPAAASAPPDSHAAVGDLVEKVAALTDDDAMRALLSRGAKAR